MGEEIKISIIMPFYNSEKTIARCVDSVLTQDYGCYELLVIDDGSTDDSVGILKSYNDGRIKILKQNHKGVSAARNLGLRKASGDYVMFLDSDDALERGALRTLIEIVSDKNNFEIIKFGYCTVDNGRKDRKDMYGLAGKVLNSNTKEDYELMIDNFFRNDNMIPCYVMTLFLPRKFIIKNKLYFDESKYMMEDGIFYLNLFRKKAKIYFYDKILYDMYENKNSVTRSSRNVINVARGAFDSVVEILTGIGYDGKSCSRCLRLVIGCMMKCGRNIDKVEDLCFCDEMKKIATIADVSKNNLFWKLVRMAILNDNKTLLRVLSYIRGVKRRIKG